MDDARAHSAPTPLSEKIVGAWLSMIDNDDSECRVTAVEMVFDICMLPLSPGLASETLVKILDRLDDNLDPIRLLLVQELGRMQQGLRRNAATIDADAARVRFRVDERDLHAEIGAEKGRGVPAGAGPENCEIGRMSGHGHGEEQATGKA